MRNSKRASLHPFLFQIYLAPIRITSGVDVKCIFYPPPHLNLTTSPKPDHLTPSPGELGLQPMSFEETNIQPTKTSSFSPLAQHAQEATAFKGKGRGPNNFGAPALCCPSPMCLSDGEFITLFTDCWFLSLFLSPLLPPTTPNTLD